MIVQRNHDAKRVAAVCCSYPGGKCVICSDDLETTFRSPLVQLEGTLQGFCQELLQGEVSHRADVG